MGKINIQGIKAGGKIIAKRLNLKPAWDTINIPETPFENEAFSVFVGATDPDTFPDPEITYSIASGSLPGGLSLNSSTGEISGTTDPVGSDTPFNFTLRAADGPLGPEQQGKAVDRDFNITVLDNVAPSFNQDPNFSIGSVAELAAASLFQITASDPNTNPQAITFSEVGAVLSGESLSLDSSGNVTGTPPNAGGTRVVTFTVRASDGVLTTDQDYDLTITDSQDPIWVTNAGALAAGTQGTAYSEFIVATDDNTIAYSVTSGALPAGTSLNSSTGEISGTPTTAESASFEITATDTIQFDATARSFSIEISLTVANSLRFNDDDSAYTELTLAASDPKLWTFSTWAKRGEIGSNTNNVLFGATVDGNNRFLLLFDADFDTLHLFARHSSSTILSKISTAVFRDPSAWYHIVVAIDTDQGTAANRNRVYVNGIEITTWSTDTNVSSGSTDLKVNTAVVHRVGDNGEGTFFDGYLAETVFIDGQQLTPTSFGEFDSNGDWQPIDTSGLTFGTNGFHLDYAVAPGTGDGGGTDVSGNLNHFSDSGLAANDQVSDTPSNNHATMNPLVPASSSITFSEGNNQIFTADNSIIHNAFGTMKINGKVYFEVAVDNTGSSNHQAVGLSSVLTPVGPSTAAFHRLGGNYWDGNGNDDSDGVTYLDGDTVRVAYDPATGKYWFGRITGGTPSWNSGASDGDVAAGTSPTDTFSIIPDEIFPLGQVRNTSQLEFHFAADKWDTTPPTGFLSLNTSNLPTPTIENPSAYFQTHIYTGTGFAHSEVFTGNSDLQPDLVWIKSRSEGTTNYIGNHELYDVLRGTTKRLQSNLEDNESTNPNGLTSFDSDGFTVGSGDRVNFSGSSFVAWNWKEGVTPGFDIVAYTGTGSTHTEVHNLGVVPDMMIFKTLDSAVIDPWAVYHSSNTSTPATGILTLNTKAANFDHIGYFNNTKPTSSVFTVGPNDSANQSGDNIIAYLWAGVEGFSKFGSYTGNASTDGPFVWCGFKPAYVMVKISVGASEDWHAFDIKRNPYNNSTMDYLWLNSSVAENSTATRQLDILSNGFKIRGNGVQLNGSGNSYIFAAFAESPFKTARAR